jgi:hypothetical protein
METRLFWWTWVLIGFGAGAYAHSAFIRHYLNYVIIKSLTGIIWLLKKVDRYQVEAKPQKPVKAKTAKAKSPVNITQDGIEVNDDELRKWLDKNPEISVTKR